MFNYCLGIFSLNSTFISLYTNLEKQQERLIILLYAQFWNLFCSLLNATTKLTLHLTFYKNVTCATLVNVSYHPLHIFQFFLKVLCTSSQAFLGSESHGQKFLNFVYAKPQFMGRNDQALGHTLQFREMSYKIRNRKEFLGCHLSTKIEPSYTRDE